MCTGAGVIGVYYITLILIYITYILLRGSHSDNNFCSSDDFGSTRTSSIVVCNHNK